MVFECLKIKRNIIQGVYEKRGGGRRGCLIKGAFNIKNYALMEALNLGYTLNWENTLLA